MTAKKKKSPVQLAAAIYGCEPRELLAHHEFEDGSIAIIAPSGQKFIYPAERILEERVKQMDTPPVTPKEAKEQEPINVSEFAAEIYAKLIADGERVPDLAASEDDSPSDELNGSALMAIITEKDPERCSGELGGSHVDEKRKPARKKRNR